MFRKWNMWSGVVRASGQRSQRPSWDRNKKRDALRHWPIFKDADVALVTHKA